jgi:hypothetical protein
MSLEDDVERLSKRVEELKELLDDMDGSWDKMADGADSASNAIEYTSKKLYGLVDAYKDFAKDSTAQLKRGMEIAESYKNVSRNLGISAKQTDNLRASFGKTLPEIRKLGFEIKDLETVLSQYSEESGRARLLSTEEGENIFRLARGLNLSEEAVAKMAEGFDLMGTSTSSMYTSLNDLYKEAQSLGLNAQKVLQVFEGNFRKMQSYSFANGVKGMTEMAKQAVKMRIEVGDVLQMSEKFYQPEAAIEAAANLQLLGGDIAKAFGDPFETMYLARNKPEELAKRLGEMTENMMTFNKETGEYEFPAEVRMQLKAAGEQLGINVDELIEMSRQTSKIKDVKMKISTEIPDEDMREQIASLARMGDDGKWVVDFKGQAIDISDAAKLEEAVKEGLLAQPETGEDAIMTQVENSFTTNEILSNIQESMKDQLVSLTRIYEIQEALLGKPLQTLGTEIPETIDVLVKKMDFEKYFSGGFESVEAFGQNISDSLKVYFDNLQATIAGQPTIDPDNIKDIQESVDSIEDLLSGVPVTPGTGGIPPTPQTTRQDDFIWRPGEDVVSFNKGDIIMGMHPINPTNGKKITEKKNDIVDVNLNMSGNLNVTNPDGTTANLDMNVLKAEIEKMIVNAINQVNREGGKTDSRTFVDSGNI